MYCVMAVKALNRGMLGKLNKENRAELVEFSAKVSNFDADDLYKNQLIRKALDECTFRLYGHWVKKQNNQSRAALFSTKPAVVASGGAS